MNLKKIIFHLDEQPARPAEDLADLSVLPASLGWPAGWGQYSGADGQPRHAGDRTQCPWGIFPCLRDTWPSCKLTVVLFLTVPSSKNQFDKLWLRYLWWFLGFSSCHKTEWQSPTPSCRDMEKIYIKTTIKMEEFIESCCLERIFQLTHTDSFSKFC